MGNLKKQDREACCIVVTSEVSRACNPEFVFDCKLQLSSPTTDYKIRYFLWNSNKTQTVILARPWLSICLDSAAIFLLFLTVALVLLLVVSIPFIREKPMFCGVPMALDPASGTYMVWHTKASFK